MTDATVTASPEREPPAWASAAPAPPRLTDGVVTLRPLADGDIDDICRSCTDPDMIRWTTIPSPYARRDAVSFVVEHGADGWASGTNPTWAIARAGSDAYCGGIDLRLDGVRGGEVGFALAPWARGLGLAPRAVALACRWAFDVAGLEVVLWVALAGNEASRRTAARVGFEILAGTLRKGTTQRGARRDAWLGTLLPGDLVPPG